MGKTKTARAAIARRKVSTAAAAHAIGCKYRCPSCGCKFQSWQRCLEHVRQHGHDVGGSLLLKQSCLPVNQTLSLYSDEDAPEAAPRVTAAMAAGAQTSPDLVEAVPNADAEDGCSWYIDTKPSADAFAPESARSGYGGAQASELHRSAGTQGGSGGAPGRTRLLDERPGACKQARTRRRCAESDVAMPEAGGDDDALRQPWWEAISLAGDAEGDGASADDDDDDDVMLARMRQAVFEESGSVVRSAGSRSGSRRQRARGTGPCGTGNALARDDADAAKRGPPPPLDGANRGYAMLQALGWAPGDGLGAAGTGVVQPLSATLPMQKSRRGLGN